MKDWLDSLQNPPADYRPLPFWSWNDRLDASFLRWQVRQMRDAGLGGFFMHARSGLETEYLGGEWMKCVAACADEAKQSGMQSWLYDEDGWPSGFAGGRVTALGDAYYGRWLSIEQAAAGEPAEGENILGVYREEGGRFCRADSTRADCPRLIVRDRFTPFYIDVMNAEAVKAFLRFTHCRYQKEMGGRVGSSVFGFFTDEPRLSGDVSGDIPWSHAIPAEFRRTYGYDILEKLPALFRPCRGFEKIRYDFWQLVSRLFVSSYIRQISGWCHENHCRLTGHIMMEESVFTQMTGSGGVMPFYEYMDMPGVDWLRRHIGNPVVPKQAGSVAAQLGKPHVLSESFAMCGWNVSFEELKWIAEWQFVNGVNRICQHLEGYSLRGQRKRDYPPSLFIQQSWWNEYRFFNDYLARLGMMLTQGREAAEVLLLHPMRTGWVCYDGGVNDAIRRVDSDFERVTETLSGMHMGYHYGDETILERHGRAEGNRLVVGQCAYRAVVLPPMRVIGARTAELLREFVRGGGRLIAAGEFPSLCAGEPNPMLAELRSRAVTASDAAGLEMALRDERRVRVRDAGGEVTAIHCQLREDGRRRILFLVNLDNRKGYDVTVTVAGQGVPCRIDLQHVRRIPLPAGPGDGVSFGLSFRPMQSHLIVLEDAPQAECRAPQPAIRLSPSPEWKIEKMDDNSLTLDTCRCRVDGGAWSEPMAVIHLMEKLLRLRRSCDIELSFRFFYRMDRGGGHRFFLALESADQFRIAVNGHDVPYRDIGWWKDSSFRKVDIRPFVVRGENEIRLKRRFFQSRHVYDTLFGKDVYETELNKLTYDVELESIYLVGDFGVVSDAPFEPMPRGALYTKGPFAVVDAPRAMHAGNFTSQGLAFFAGRLVLSQPIVVPKAAGRRVLLDLGRPDAAMVRVRVNGRDAGVLLWPPFEADVTDLAQPGENKLELELFASNRNLLGPHHHKRGELYSVGPGSFTGRWSWAEKESELLPATPEQQAENFWKPGYCMVRFGTGGQRPASAD